MNKLTKAQMRIWSNQVLYSGSNFANIAFLTSPKQISGGEPEIIEKTLNLVVERNDALRMRFFLTGENPLEDVGFDVDSYKPFEVERINFSDYEEMMSWVKRRQELSFPLYDSNLYEFAMLFINSALYIFVKFSHLVSDGFTLAAVNGIITDAFEATSIKDIEIPSVSYESYKKQEDEYLTSPNFLSDAVFWENLLDFSPEKLQFDKLALETDVSKGSTFSYNLSENVLSSFHNICADYRVSPFSLSTLFWHCVLCRMLSVDEMVIAFAKNGRKGVTRNVLGMCVDTILLPMKGFLDRDLASALSELSSQLKQTFIHGRYPLQDIISNRRKLGLSTEALADIVISDVGGFFSGQGILSCLGSDSQLPLAVYLDINAKGSGAGQIFFRFFPDSITVDILKRICDSFSALIISADKNRHKKLSYLDIVSDEQRNLLLSGFNNNFFDLKEDVTVCDYITSNAIKNPNSPAVEDDKGQYSYKELEERSNSLAIEISKKIVPGEFAVIMLPRIKDIYIAELAVMKAGCAYIPVDPDYPDARIADMIADSGAKLILTSTEFTTRVSAFGIDAVDISCEELYCENKVFKSIAKPNELAYIIYTSGSTGKPKGVMIQHNSLLNALNNFVNFYGIDESAIAASYASFSFDVSIIDSWPFLISGGKVFVIPSDLKLDLFGLSEYLKKNEITDLHLPTQFGEQFLQIFDSAYIKRVLVGGEKMRRFIPGNYKLYNSYGPTETAIDTNFHLVERDYKNIPIGRPGGNVYEYVIDSNSMLVPIGTPGELCIAGVQLARGYLNREDLTREKFVKNPYAIDESNSIIYRTGDLARWNNSGEIEHLGRIDRQVKISGYRIELGEIEKALSTIPSIKEAAVVDLSDGKGGKFLCAYYSAQVPIEEILFSQTLEKTLPKYMVPSFFVFLDKIPITPSGKVDRKRLPAVNKSDKKSSFAPPENDLQMQLFKVWEDILGHVNFGIDDNFFSVGGNSLKAISMQAKLKKASGLSITAPDIMKNQTIRRIALKALDYSEIPRRESELESYPLTPPQQQMYILRKTLENETTYNIPTTYKIKGSFDEDRFLHSLNHIIASNSSLRSYFISTEEGLRQKTADTWQLEMLRGEVSESEAGETITSWIRPFNLEEPLLLRCGLLKLKEGGVIFFLDIHHIISDGISISLFMEELSKVYSGKSDTSENADFLDYALYLEKNLSDDKLESQRNYWLEQMQGELPYSEIIPDYQRPPVMSQEGQGEFCDVSGETLKGLRLLAASRGISLFSVVLSAWAYLLSKYTASEDVILGVPFSGRNLPGLENIMGMFVSTQAMRFYPKHELYLGDYLDTVGKLVIDAQTNQNYPVANLISDLDIGRDSSRNPLYSSVFNYFVFPSSSDELSMQRAFYGDFKAHFDLAIEVREQKDSLLLGAVYAVKLYSKETVSTLLKRFVTVLNFFAKPNSQNSSLSHISIFEPGEYELLKEGLGFNKLDFDDDKTVHELFKIQAGKTPDNVAVVFGDRSLTYRELDEISDKVAAVLIEKGIERESIVALLMERSERFVICSLAVLKAGGAYMPIDANAPAGRISYMIEDSNAIGIIADDSLINKVKAYNLFVLNAQELSVAENEPIIKSPSYSASDLMVLLYTSGSTGNPKGVQLEHRSVVSLCAYAKHKYGLTGNDACAACATFAFDATLNDVYPFLLSGGSVHIIPEDLRLNLPIMNKYFEQNKISFSFMTTQLGRQFIENYNPSCLRYFFVGGEKLGAWTKESRGFYNIYGPTECTVYINGFFVDKPSLNAPIGKPISNVKEYVLDKNDAILPYGMPGELCVAGPGVTRGYLGLPEFTQEKLIPNPFCDEPYYNRIYRTGDIVRWLRDGNLEFLDRVDKQVKIRGYRIEIGEIQMQISKLDVFESFVVTDIADPLGGKYLCCYYTVNKDVDIENVKECLLQELPYYMIPTVFMKLDLIPLNQNGKVDKKALPLPEKTESSDYVPPNSEIEAQICEIWSKLLDAQNVGIRTNFFEIGGNSIKAVTLQVRLQKEFGKLLTVGTILQNPTVEQQAALIHEESSYEYNPLAKAKIAESYPLTPPQQQMYVLWETLENKTAYNVSVAFSIKGRLDTALFSSSIDELIMRHASLRTYFKESDGELRQFILDPGKIKCKKMFCNASESEVKNILSGWITPFYLDRAPLIRFGLIQVTQEEFVFLMDAHHIVIDGISLSVLMKELMDIYHGNNLKDIVFEYSDYSVWYRQNITGEILDNQKKVWLGQFAEGVPLLELPCDYPRPQLQNTSGACVSFVLEGEAFKNLQKIAASKKTTLFPVLLSAWAITLARSAGTEEIVIGVPHSGRTLPELESMTGMFVNTLPMYLHPESTVRFSDFLSGVIELENLLQSNQYYSLSDLVQAIGLPRDLSRNALFDVSFNYLQSMDSRPQGNIEVMPYDRGIDSIHFDLSLSTVTGSKSIAFNLIYATALYSKESAQTFLTRLKMIISQMSLEEDRFIGAFDMLTPQERNTLLNGFNATSMPVDRSKTVCDLIEEHAIKTPGAYSVADEHGFYTYGELYGRSSSLASKIASKATRGSFVAIIIPRIKDIYVAELGIMKAGCAYIPMDPDYPDSRILDMLADSNASLIVTTSDLADRIKGFGLPYIDIEDSSIYEKGLEFKSLAKPEGLAYVIYTSGSTGKPKGVMVQHDSLTNILTCFAVQFELDSSSKTAAYASFSFDVSIIDSYPFLVAGGQVFVIPQEMRLDFDALSSFLTENHITDIHLPTQFGEQFVQVFESPYMKRMLIGGEKMRRFFKKNFKIYNSYGPTETAIDTNFHLVEKNYANIPIGRPSGNVFEYVLDRAGALVPIGVPGELCIAGIQTARGYLNRPELTAEKFVENPYASGSEYSRMYKTGDLARWNRNGEIEHLGRIDRQVKISGYRIEIGEVELAISAIDAIKEVAVIDFPDTSGGKYLCAYCCSQKNMDANEIRLKLAATLPNYMIPEVILFVDSIPLTTSGKVDRARLPKPEHVKQDKEITPPQTEEQIQIADAWKEVLGHENFGIDDNFFEVGGNSLKAIRVVTLLKSSFEININKMYIAPTIRLLADQCPKSRYDLKSALLSMKLAKPVQKGVSGEELFPEQRAEYNDLIAKIDSLELSSKIEVKSVLLCGATGFLGAFLLRELLLKKDCHIHAIVRAKTNEDACSRLESKMLYYFGDDYKIENTRLTVWSGDLTADSMGLSDDTYLKLASEVDVVINTAANVRHYGVYEEFYKSNVQTVKNMIDFAKSQKKKRLCHVSTMSVAAGNIPDLPETPFTEMNVDMGQQIDNVYVKTKLIAETEVMLAFENGVDTQIFRVGNITPDSENGRMQQNIEENGFFSTISSMLNLGVMPLSASKREFSYVDKIAQAIVLMFDSKALGGQIFHIHNPNLVDLSKFFTKDFSGVSMNILSQGDYLNYLVERIDFLLSREVIESIMLHAGWLDAKSNNTRFFVWSGRTHAILERLGFDWGEMSRNALIPMVRKAFETRADFLKKLPVFASLSKEDILNFAGLARMDIYAGGDIIDYDNSNELGFLQQGMLEQFIKSANGWLGTVKVLKQGDVFGYNNLTSTKSSSVYETLFGEAQVLWFTGEDMTEIIKASPSVPIYMIAELAKNLERFQRVWVNMG